MRPARLVRLLYLGGSPDGRAASTQAQLAATGAFGIHWCRDAARVGELIRTGSVDCVLLDPSLDPSTVESVLAAAGGLPVMTIEADHAEVGSDRRPHLLRPGPDLPDQVNAWVSRGPDRAHTQAGSKPGRRFVDEIEISIEESTRPEPSGSRHGPLVGHFEWDLGVGRFDVNGEWLSIAGLAEPPSRHPDVWFDRVHADDLGRLLRAIEDHLEGRTTNLDVTYRFGDRASGFHRVRTRALVIRDASGMALTLPGSLELLAPRPGVRLDGPAGSGPEERNSVVQPHSG